MSAVRPASLPAAALLVPAVCVALAVLALIWPGLVTVSTARPDTWGGLALDGLRCFGPLGMPLAGLGGVVVWVERNG